MKSNSDKFPPFSKGRGDLWNILEVVISVSEDCFYRSGTASGILKSLFARSKFTVYSKKMMQLEGVPLQETFLLYLVSFKHQKADKDL